ncbi:CDP-2,3-bis-(O-geranylgeranyl)-sn-glycerol synthase [archaeon]|nr:CDP-2,3-bis-(O-geranylgeranyl)-sn-glycerol synthase [archaeon]
MAETIYIFLPAYLANATPVLLGGGGPLDGGRTWRDGEPFLGDHKTVRGTLSGVAAGILTGLIQGAPLRGVLLAVGAIGGDLIVSFIKRRLKLKPGALLPLADQMDFIVFAVILLSLFQPLPTLDRIIAILVATLPIHYLTNVLAWLLKLKSNPW